MMELKNSISFGMSDVTTERALHNVVVLGANISSKSNVVLAFRVLKCMAHNSCNCGSGNDFEVDEPFAYDERLDGCQVDIALDLAAVVGCFKYGVADKEWN